MGLNKTALGLTAGILWGLSVLIATIWVMAFGGGEHLRLLDRFYIGYDVTAVGAGIGLVYGFVDGFISGWIFGWLYNRLAGSRG